VWTNELGKGNNHTLNNVPFVLVGGGLDYRMNRFVTYPNVAHNRFLMSLAHGFGHRINTFGNHWEGVAECPSCGERHELNWARGEIGRLGRAPHCRKCAGIVKTATISFGQPMPEDVMAQAQCRLAEAGRRDRSGDAEAAAEAAEDAVDVLTGTDTLDLQGDAFATLGRMRRYAGDGAAAASALREAVERYERKGNAVSAARAREER
jgi:hypothetical protein